jgi:hypothetical protein
VIFAIFNFNPAKMQNQTAGVMPLQPSSSLSIPYRTSQTASSSTGSSKYHRNMVASYIAGASGVLVGFPLDSIKTRMVSPP